MLIYNAFMRLYIIRMGQKVIAVLKILNYGLVSIPGVRVLKICWNMRIGLLGNTERGGQSKGIPVSLAQPAPAQDILINKGRE